MADETSETTSAEAESIPAFHLDVDVEHPDLVQWLASVPKAELSRAVENTLRAGHMVLTMVQAASGEDAMRRFFRPVTEPMNELQETLLSMLSATKKSQRLGELGEEVVAKQLQQAFPGDSYQVVSKGGHQADIHADFAVGADDFRKGIVEVKLYSDDVPSKELEKFRRDLQSTGIRYGLMVSLTSRLMGVSGPIKLEETDDYVALFVPHAGLDGRGVIWGAAILKSIIAYESKAEAATRIPTGAIEQAWNRIQAELQELEEIGRDVQGFLDTVRTIKQSVDANLDALAEKALSSKLRMKLALQRLTGRLADELHGLPHVGERLAIPVSSDPETVLSFIADLAAKDKRRPAYEGLYALCTSNELAISFDEQGAWTFSRDGEVIATTGGTKSRLDLCIPVPMDAPVDILPGIESLKGDTVTVDGKDVSMLLDRARHWLGV